MSTAVALLCVLALGCLGATDHWGPPVRSNDIESINRLLSDAAIVARTPPTERANILSLALDTVTDSDTLLNMVHTFSLSEQLSSGPLSKALQRLDTANADMADRSSIPGSTSDFLDGVHERVRLRQAVEALYAVTRERLVNDNPDGRTPLMEAVITRNSPLIRYLRIASLYF